MNRKTLLVPACIAIAGVVGAFAVAQPAKDKAPAGQPEMKLPPGWTSADMEACTLAGTPGKQHEWLAKGAGTWQGKCTSWMYEGAEAIKSECTETATVIMDGRFLKCEIAGDSPVMGPFQGLGTSGFDNASQKFVSNWIDNHSTGIWNGTGELSADQKTLTWNYTYNCPITKKPATAREVIRFTSPTAKTLEMFVKDPKSGKEFKMMTIEFTKK